MNPFISNAELFNQGVGNFPVVFYLLEFKVASLKNKTVLIGLI